MAKIPEIKIRKMDPNLSTMSITVKITKGFRLRFYIACKLLTLAAKIMGFMPVITWEE
jgi:hypothetical protein